MSNLGSVILSSLSIISFICAMNNDHSISYETLYDLGMDAYKQGKWSKCSEFFQSAIEDYHFYKNTVIDCRLKCQKIKSDNLPNNSSFVFHDILVESNCLRRCKKKKLGNRAEEAVSIAVDKKFEDRNAYNFMQFCYFKEDRLTEAAAASYTYYILHQDDERILENLQYYRSLPDVTEDDFVDLERRPYQTKYINGLTAYNEGRWREAAAAFEEAISLYYAEEERCRAGCEKGFGHNGFPDFINAIADHYVTVIVCQQRCLKKLSTFGMSEIENFVSEHYNYLQYSYYEAKNLEKAFESIASYLLFRPDDDEMLRNKEYYIKTFGYKESAFIPSQDAVAYVDLWKEISRSLDFVREKYILPRDEIPDDDDMELDSAVQQGGKHEQGYGESVRKFESIGIKLVQEPRQLTGKDRFVADGFIRGDQCEALADLARSKDYSETGSREVTLAEAIQLVKTDGGYEISLRLLLRAVDVMKAYTSAYFNQSELVIQEVKVICKSPGADSDASPPEDCVLQETGECMGKHVNKQNFMTIAYLTDMLDGSGQFYFTSGSGLIQASVEPMCGMMLGFSARNSHKVNLPWKHERCSIVISLTSDSRLQSKDIEAGKVLLSELEVKHVKHFSADGTEILQQFYDQGVKIIMTGEDLHGKERFVADGLSTPEECNTLIELARQEGLSGDGYAGRVSPHTDFEIFMGLDIKHAKQIGVTEGDGYNHDQSSNPAAIKFVSPYTEFEIFEGLNVSRTFKLVEEKIVNPETIQLFLDVSEHSRLLVEKYFNLSRPLYFDYTHLVCRTALDSDEEDRAGDLSHPVHSDNCMIQPDGSCVQDPLAYAQRHYSAVMYLNDDFEGGHFFFAHKNKSEQVSLKPKCGRLVAFNAGEFHGVKAVTKGQRCAVAMWYTHDPNYVEVSRIHTQRTLEKLLKQLKSKNDKELTDTENISDVETSDIKVSSKLDISPEESRDEL